MIILFLFINSVLITLTLNTPKLKKIKLFFTFYKYIPIKKKISKLIIKKIK